MFLMDDLQGQKSLLLLKGSVFIPEGDKCFTAVEKEGKVNH